MLDKVKRELRIKSDAFDQEIQDLIDDARMDLIQSGVAKSVAEKDEPDPLIRRAIIFYAKAYYGMDNPDAARFTESYQMLKNHISLAGDYDGRTVE